MLMLTWASATNDMLVSRKEKASLGKSFMMGELIEGDSVIYSRQLQERGQTNRTVLLITQTPVLMMCKYADFNHKKSASK